ncbi:aldolase/citrate lyase family protein [Hydrogenimonas sp.]
MYKLEQALYEQLCKLRDEYGLKGIKAEFEAEGSSLQDLNRLRRLTSRAGTGLYLKIGGVEAIRDIKEALEVGVDGLIAPMVESTFGAKKFYDAYSKLYGEHPVHTTLNVETRNAIDELDDILDYAVGRFDNITIGRSDLSRSYFDEAVVPDSDFILNLLVEAGRKIRQKGLSFTVGGSVSARTIEKINKEYPELKTLIQKLETRKVMLPTDIFLEKDGAIKEALKFEELYILSKKEFSDMYIASEITRLTELQRRK